MQSFLEFCGASSRCLPAQSSMPYTLMCYGVVTVALWLLLQPLLVRAASTAARFSPQHSTRRWLDWFSLGSVGQQISRVLRKPIKEAALRKSQEGAPRPTADPAPVSLPVVVRPDFSEHLVHRGYRGRTRLAGVGIKIWSEEAQESEVEFSRVAAAAQKALRSVATNALAQACWQGGAEQPQLCKVQEQHAADTLSTADQHVVGSSKPGQVLLLQSVVIRGCVQLVGCVCHLVDMEGQAGQEQPPAPPAAPPPGLSAVVEGIQQAEAAQQQQQQLLRAAGEPSPGAAAEAPSLPLEPQRLATEVLATLMESEAAAYDKPEPAPDSTAAAAAAAPAKAAAAAESAKAAAEPEDPFAVPAQRRGRNLLLDSASSKEARDHEGLYFHKPVSSAADAAAQSKVETSTASDAAAAAYGGKAVHVMLLSEGSNASLLIDCAFSGSEVLSGGATGSELQSGEGQGGSSGNAGAAVSSATANAAAGGNAGGVGSWLSAAGGDASPMYQRAAAAAVQQQQQAGTTGPWKLLSPFSSSQASQQQQQQQQQPSPPPPGPSTPEGTTGPWKLPSPFSSMEPFPDEDEEAEKPMPSQQQPQQPPPPAKHGTTGPWKLASPFSSMEPFPEVKEQQAPHSKQQQQPPRLQQQPPPKHGTTGPWKLASPFSSMEPFQEEDEQQEVPPAPQQQQQPQQHKGTGPWKLSSPFHNMPAFEDSQPSPPSHASPTKPPMRLRTLSPQASGAGGVNSHMLGRTMSRANSNGRPPLPQRLGSMAQQQAEEQCKDQHKRLHSVRAGSSSMTSTPPARPPPRVQVSFGGSSAMLGGHSGSSSGSGGMGSAGASASALSGAPSLMAPLAGADPCGAPPAAASAAAHNMAAAAAAAQAATGMMPAAMSPTVSQELQHMPMDMSLGGLQQPMASITLPPAGLSCITVYPAALTEALPTEACMYVMGLDSSAAGLPYRAVAFQGSMTVADVTGVFGPDFAVRVPLPPLLKGVVQLALLMGSAATVVLAQPLLVLPAPCAAEMVMLWSSLLLAGLHSTPQQGNHHHDQPHSSRHHSPQRQHQRRSRSSDGSPCSAAATTSAPWQLSVQTSGQVRVIEVTPQQVAAAWQGQFVPLVTDIAYLLSAHFHPSTMVVAASPGQVGVASPSVTDRPEFRAVVTPIVQFLASNACWATLQFVTDSVYGAGASAKALYSAGSAAARASSSGAPSVVDTHQQPPSAPASVTDDCSTTDVRNGMELHGGGGGVRGTRGASEPECIGDGHGSERRAGVQEQKASQPEAGMPDVSDALGLMWRAIKAAVRRRTGATARGSARPSAP